MCPPPCELSAPTYPHAQGEGPTGDRTRGDAQVTLSPFPPSLPLPSPKKMLIESFFSLSDLSLPCPLAPLIASEMEGFSYRIGSGAKVS